jgi:HNH endonuclease
MALSDNFWKKIEKRDDGCWMWIGSLSNAGYGRFNGGTAWRAIHKTRIAHRLAFMAIKGEIPTGLTLDHLCRNRACVNPDHLDPCPIGVNTRRSPIWNGNKTHCPEGHSYSGKNLGVSKRCDRFCRTCINRKAREYKSRLRQAALDKSIEM